MLTLLKNKRSIKRSQTYSDIELVLGVANSDPSVEQALYSHCKTYFFNKVNGVFFVSDEFVLQNIFQDSFLKLWENIEHKKIEVSDGVLIGHNKQPFKGTLNTYLMAIAKNKFLEWARTTKRELELFENTDYSQQGFDSIAEDIKNGNDYNEVMRSILAECVSKMPKRCCQILTQFYYNNMNLDEIISATPSFHSKNALKTSKNKCLNTLRKSATELYKSYLEHE